MKSFALGLVAATLLAGTALAQTTAPATTSPSTAPAATAPAGRGMATTPGMAPMPATPGTVTSPGMATAPTAGSTGMMGGRAAASGNDNQAVATTTANAATPAHGANSFTQGEARRRIAARGFTHIANLKKDRNGVWRGTAEKDGATTGVWLDYKGNVGQAAS